MFRPLPMQRVSLGILRDDAPATARHLAECGVFNPEMVSLPEEQMAELPAEHYCEVYSSARVRLDKIMSRLEYTLDHEIAEPRVVEIAELERLDARLGELWRQFSEMEEELRTLEEKRKSVAQLHQSLQIFADLDIDLGLLHGTKRFVALYIGTIARQNLARLERAVALAGYFARSFHSATELDYVLVAGPAESSEDIRGLLDAADFRPITIPPEFSDYPEKIDQELSAQGAELDHQVADKLKQIEDMGQKYRHELSVAWQALRVAAPYAELGTKVRGRGALALLEGWVPTDRVSTLSEALHAPDSGPFIMRARDPLPDERSQVPSALRHSRLLKPFTALVKNYGVPRYGEIDPTLLFTATFIAMFGMMFGDVGHGAVIVAIGLAIRRRFPIVVPAFVAAGISSITFGFLYGSIFGYEELVHPLWMSPLSDPMLMLMVALYWGIAFILIVSALTVRNLIAEGRFREALFDDKGLAGIALYLGGLYGGFRWMGEGRFGLLEMLALLVPITVILAYKWRENKSRLGEKVLVVFVEGFEAIVKYLANTLSFLRVAAFSLNHVALAVAVFTLADMMGVAGHWLTVVLGNIFIIVLEGAIVTIQVLRLEYYEGFSRFFSGDGREFRPLQLGARLNVRG